MFSLNNIILVVVHLDLNLIFFTLHVAFDMLSSWNKILIDTVLIDEQ